VTPPRWRLFIGHPVPATTRKTLDQSLRPYRAARPHVRWTSPESWHLTLLFLGSVGADRVTELRCLMEQEAVRWAPYQVRAASGGGRFSRGEGVAWLALYEGAGTLIELAAALAEHCPSDITTGPPPRRTPSAHLTVARRADRAVIDALRRQTYGPLAVTWTVDRLGLIRSHLGPDGAHYETVHEVPL
jgi:2'-5' RNA ligase